MTSSLASAAATVRIALCQMIAGSDKAANLAIAVAAVAAAAREGARIVALPECFNSPYATDQFPIYAEPIPASREELDPALHPSTAALSAVAREHEIFLIGGAWAAGGDGCGCCARSA